MEFSTVRKQVFERYTHQQYAEAIALIHHSADFFPQQAAQILYWRLCLYACLNQREHIHALLADCQATGQWLAPAMLRTDPDLQAVHDDPQFVAFCTYCDQQLAQRKPNTQATLTVLAPPSVPLEQWPVLLVLHGNMSSAQETLPEWHSVTSHGWGVAVLQSSQLAGPEIYAWNDLDQALRDLTEHWDHLTSQYSCDPHRIVLGGFSRGAGVAIVAAMRRQVPAYGVIAVSPAIPLVDQLTEAHASASCAGYLIVGQEDAVSLKQCHQAVALTEHAKKPWSIEIVPQLGHEYPMKMAGYLEAALTFLG